MCASPCERLTVAKAHGAWAERRTRIRREDKQKPNGVRTARAFVVVRAPVACRAPHFTSHTTKGPTVVSAPRHHRTHHPAAPTGRSDDTPDDNTEAWTLERIRALGVVTDLATAARIFGLSRAGAYDLARRGIFPVTVLRFGTRYRVSVAAILHALGQPPPDAQHPDRPSSRAT